jgi:hypothetical protein
MHQKKPTLSGTSGVGEKQQSQAFAEPKFPDDANPSPSHFGQRFVVHDGDGPSENYKEEAFTTCDFKRQPRPDQILPDRDCNFI